MSEARGLFGWIGVVVQRWPWAVIGFWIALAAVLSVTARRTDRKSVV